MFLSKKTTFLKKRNFFELFEHLRRTASLNFVKNSDFRAFWAYSWNWLGPFDPSKIWTFSWGGAQKGPNVARRCFPHCSFQVLEWSLEVHFAKDFRTQHLLWEQCPFALSRHGPGGRWRVPRALQAPRVPVRNPAGRNYLCNPHSISTERDFYDDFISNKQFYWKGES